MLTSPFNRNGSPILVTLVSFWHFAVVREQVLTPSIAFTSVSLACLAFYDFCYLFMRISRLLVRQTLRGHLFIAYLYAFSFLRDEIRPQRVTGDFYQHAPSMCGDPLLDVD